MAGETLDNLDKKIVEELCSSSQGSYRQIAKRLGVHPTTLIQRVKSLEAKGVINGYRAIVDYLKLGYEFMGVVHIYVEGDLLEIQKKIMYIDQVISVFDVTGDYDSIAWVACVDRDEFSDVVKRILAIRGVKKTNTSVILNIVKDPMKFVPHLLDKEPEQEPERTD
jgi:DNA-binding Lrp family transcriptional regulator